MGPVYVAYGASEKIQVTCLDGAGAFVTGLSDVLVEIRRRSDGKYYDWADGSFKSSGWTTRQGVMAELDAANSPGAYHRDFPTAGYSAATVEEQYFVRASTAASNVENDPFEGELRVGGWINVISSPGGGTIVTHTRLSDAEIAQLAQAVWRVKLDKEKTARQVLLERSTFDPATQAVRADLEPVLAQLERLGASVESIGTVALGSEEARSLAASQREDIAAASAAIGGGLQKLSQGLGEVIRAVQDVPRADPMPAAQLEALAKASAEVVARTIAIAQGVSSIGEQIARVSPYEQVGALLDKIAESVSLYGARFDALASQLSQQDVRTPLADLAADTAADMQRAMEELAAIKLAMISA